MCLCYLDMDLNYLVQHLPLLLWLHSVYLIDIMLSGILALQLMVQLLVPHFWLERARLTTGPLHGFSDT